jgi:hypothetical protein
MKQANCGKTWQHIETKVYSSRMTLYFTAAFSLLGAAQHFATAELS